MEFRYIAATTTGVMRRGTLEAASREEAAQRLRQRNLSVLAITGRTGRLINQSMGDFGLARVSALDKVLFTRHLALMLRAGLSLVEALDTIQSQTPSKKLKQVVKQLIQDVSNGKTLADAMSRHHRVFSMIFIGMVRIGESSGTLEENLDYIAGELEKDYELKRKVRSALLYPTVVLSATIVIGTGLSIFILPRLVQLFSTFRVALPPITVVFLNIATFLVRYGWYVLGAVVVLAVLFRVALLTARVRRLVDRSYLRLPIIKNLIRNAYLARITRIVSILLKSGITINESIDITARAIENSVYRDQLERAQSGVQKGQTLSSLLDDVRYFPTMASRMIGVGERTGKLDESLRYLAAFYEDEVDNATKNLATVLEPALLLFIGVVLGFLAIAIISPIYQFTGSLQP